MAQGNRDADVVVVGAGLSGLTATTRLQRLNAKVITLEARSEVGGRTRSRTLSGHTFDLGGEFVGPHHRRIRRLAREHGLSLEDSRLTFARTLWRLDDQQRVGYLPRLSASELLALARTTRALARLAKDVPAEEPWRAPDASALDACSFGEWLTRQGMKGRSRRLFAAMFEALATTRLEQLSLLQVLWWISRAGGPLAAQRDVNAMRISGGAQTLCLRLAEGLGDPVKLSKPVRLIRHGDADVVVEAGEEDRWRTPYAIVCVPLPALRKIEFIPALEEPQQALLREARFGQATSVVVAAQEKIRSRHRLVVGGDALPLAWRTNGGAKGVFLDPEASEDPGALVEDLSRAFGFDSLGVEADVVRWAGEPFIGGTYVVFEPGQLARHGPHLRRPHGRIHFAAAERSSWPDSMEGAVESGTLAAEHVAAALRT